jgi:phospholipid/cholesterol/gamma-HCH transport system permease protein
MIVRKTIDLLGDLGFFIRSNIVSLGHSTRMFIAVIARSAPL